MRSGYKRNVEQVDEYGITNNIRSNIFGKVIFVALPLTKETEIMTERIEAMSGSTINGRGTLIDEEHSTMA